MSESRLAELFNAFIGEEDGDSFELVITRDEAFELLSGPHKALVLRAADRAFARSKAQIARLREFASR